MISPLQPSDKTIMPLRGEGNQPVKPPHVINLKFEGDGFYSQEQIRQLISRITQLQPFA